MEVVYNGAVVGLIIAETDVGTDTTEHAYCYQAVGVVLTEQVGEVESSVDHRSDVVPLPFVHHLCLSSGIAVISEFRGQVPCGLTGLALPRVKSEAGTNHFVELIAYTELCVRRNQVFEAKLTQGILTTNLGLQIPVGSKYIFSLGLFLS